MTNGYVASILPAGVANPLPRPGAPALIPEPSHRVLIGMNRQMPSTSGAALPIPLTRELASYAARARFDTLPDRIRVEASRAFLNWMGCALGGCQEPAVAIAAATAAELGGAPRASIIGHGQRTDMASAAFVNCMSSSILAFDDAHLATVTHPSGPAASALFAFSETRTVRGEEFVAALALGIEIQCRISNVLLLPPSRFNVGFYVTGLSGPIGVAAAVGHLLGLDEQRMRWALGLAASQASGFRATHGTMAAHFRPGHATRAGVCAAICAAQGLACSDDALEAEKGFLDVFSAGADVGRALAGLGEDFELLRNTYKPYPCGIVIHPTLDACLDIGAGLDAADVVTDATLRVHPLALRLTGKREPRDALEAAISIYHWAASALLRRRAGLAEMREDCIADPAIAGLRSRITAIPDADLRSDEAFVEVILASGRTLAAHVTTTRGSIARPMTDAELDSKFREQAGLVLPSAKTERLLQLCRSVGSLTDVGGQVGAVWTAG